jgi:hypothetical protein
MMYFYDSAGAGCCFSPDNTTLYLWSGRPAAYVVDNVVYTFAGRHLGWFDAGWLTDRANKPALFTPDAAGGPRKPAIRQMGPMPGQPQQIPVKAMASRPPARPALGRDWSARTNATYFSQ